MSDKKQSLFDDEDEEGMNINVLLFIRVYCNSGSPITVRDLKLTRTKQLPAAT
jgi:hypothetical protein